MTTEERKRRDAAAAYLLLTNRSGCLLPTLLAVVIVWLGVTRVLAQAVPFDVPYPQAAYVLADPIESSHLLLAAPSGRWTLQTDPADCVAPNTQVWLTAPLEDITAALGLDDGTLCALDPGVRILRQPVPCATRDGVCDLSREPQAQWWEVP